MALESRKLIYEPFILSPKSPKCIRGALYYRKSHNMGRGTQNAPKVSHENYSTFRAVQLHKQRGGYTY